MSIAERLGQGAVLLILAALLVWGASRRIARRRAFAVDRFRRHQEP